MAELDGGERATVALRAVPIGALLVDPDGGTILAANPAADEAFGAAGAPLVGAVLAELVAPDARNEIDRLLADGSGHEIVARCVGDAPRWVALRASGSRPVVVVARDATEEVRTFRVLREVVDTVVVVGPEGERTWGPVGREHPPDRPSQLPGSAMDRLHPEDHAQAIAVWARVVEEPGRRDRVDARLRTPDLRDEWVTTQMGLANLAHVDAVGGLLVTVNHEALGPTSADAAGAYLSVAEAAPVGIVLTGPKGLPVYFNPATRDLLPGVGPGELDRDWLARAAVELRDDLRAWFSGLVACQGEGSRTVPFDVGGARPRWLLVTVGPRHLGDEVVGFVVTLQDVTAEREIRHELEEAQQRLLYLAAHDPLTGLANRSRLAHHLEQIADAPERDSRLGVLYVDLDEFKAVNDRFGHAAGDQVLIEVAGRLRAVAGPDDLVARLGGDEFLVVACPGTSEGLVDMADRVGRALDVPIDVDGEPVVVGASVGAALHRPGEDVEELLRRADHEMYRDKAAARRRPPAPPDQ